MTSRQYGASVYIVVLGAIFMLGPFAIDLYLPAFPTLASEFRVEIDQIENSLAIFLFGFALGQLFLGPISDRYGRRVVLLAGTFVFIAASFMAGAADTLGAFYFWRLVQALGGAGAVAVFPLVQDRFDEATSGKVISYIMALVLVAPVLAPLLGGYILVFWGWRPIFWVIGGIGVMALLATLVVVDKPARDRPRRSLLYTFGRYRAVLGDARIVYAVLASGFVFAGIFAFIAGSPFVYITYYGIAAENYGYLVGLNAAVMVLVNILNGRRLSRVDPVKKIVLAGLGLVATGSAVLGTAILDLGILPLVGIVIAFFAATALAETNAVIAALQFRPSDNGSVSALIGAAQFGFGAVSSFAVGVIPSTNAKPLALIMLLSASAVLISAYLLRRAITSAGKPVCA